VSRRFYALRLHEIGMIKSSPHRIIADGTDWRFLDEVKREPAYAAASTNYYPLPYYRPLAW
jgi:hypothetical protein